MPEEIEVPTEHLHEHMEHHAGESGERWVLGVALSSAFLAAFAAVASLMAGHSVNEAVLQQIKAADQWNYYQAKGIKAAVLASKIELLDSLHRSISKKDLEKVKQYKDDQEAVKEKADEAEKDSERLLGRYKGLASSVTLFQIAIAVGAISALTRKKPFWFVSLGFGVIGAVFFLLGFL